MRPPKILNRCISKLRRSWKLIFTGFDVLISTSKLPNMSIQLHLSFEIQRYKNLRPALGVSPIKKNRYMKPVIDRDERRRGSELHLLRKNRRIARINSGQKYDESEP